MVAPKQSTTPKVKSMPDIWQPGIPITTNIVDAFAKQVRKCKSYNLHHGIGGFTLKSYICRTTADYIVGTAAGILDQKRELHAKLIRRKAAAFVDPVLRKYIRRLLRRIVDRVVYGGQVTKQELYD